MWASMMQKRSRLFRLFDRGDWGLRGETRCRWTAGVPPALANNKISTDKIHSPAKRCVPARSRSFTLAKAGPRRTALAQTSDSKRAGEAVKKSLLQQGLGWDSLSL
jgi:hypothetical protein